MLKITKVFSAWNGFFIARGVVESIRSILFSKFPWPEMPTISNPFLHLKQSHFAPYPINRLTSTHPLISISTLSGNICL